MARYASGNDAIAGEFMAAVMPELDDWLFDKDTAIGNSAAKGAKASN